MVSRSLLLLVFGLAGVEGLTSSSLFSSRTRDVTTATTSLSSSFSQASSSSAEEQASTTTYIPLFDFAKNDTIDKIERLDDAIMGGISTSAVTNVLDQPYARWSGVCRTDGGGFCGYRTNPFREPLPVGDADGFYVVCRLASDEDVDKRVWKMSTRVRPDRGEELYQAPFTFQQSGDSWSTVKVPFSSFRLVRGPRIMSDGASLDTSGGIYQVGMTMSKFVFGKNLTELEGFRDGFFEFHMKEIGLYKDSNDKAAQLAPVVPNVLTKQEAQKQRPLVLKVLLPIAKLFFSEQSQRRKSAMKILREKRGLSRLGAIMFGLKSRARSSGLLPSLAKTLAILAVDSFRFIMSFVLRICLFYPLRLVRKTVALFKPPRRRQASS